MRFRSDLLTPFLRQRDVLARRQADNNWFRDPRRSAARVSRRLRLHMEHLLSSNTGPVESVFGVAPIVRSVAPNFLTNVPLHRHGARRRSLDREKNLYNFHASQVAKGSDPDHNLRFSGVAKESPVPMIYDQDPGVVRDKHGSLLHWQLCCRSKDRVKHGASLVVQLRRFTGA